MNEGRLRAKSALNKVLLLDYPVYFEGHQHEFRAYARPDPEGKEIAPRCGFVSTRSHFFAR